MLKWDIKLHLRDMKLELKLGIEAGWPCRAEKGTKTGLCMVPLQEFTASAHATNHMTKTKIQQQAHNSSRFPLVMSEIIMANTIQTSSRLELTVYHHQVIMSPLSLSFEPYVSTCLLTGANPLLWPQCWRCLGQG